GLAIWRGDEYILSFCSLIGFSSSRRITPSSRKSNELLVINLAAVAGLMMMEALLILELSEH
ncbi:MAG TPA: hypothetical protein PLR98_14190, partial [Chitinophagaceae bacterium]|nr:hypothetical protein [Chitinophagaceae bacterium]